LALFSRRSLRLTGTATLTGLGSSLGSSLGLADLDTRRLENIHELRLIYMLRILRNVFHVPKRNLCKCRNFLGGQIRAFVCALFLDCLKGLLGVICASGLEFENLVTRNNLMAVALKGHTLGFVLGDENAQFTATSGLCLLEGSTFQKMIKVTILCALAITRGHVLSQDVLALGIVSALGLVNSLTVDQFINLTNCTGKGRVHL
jgi:hypothetical protein